MVFYIWRARRRSAWSRTDFEGESSTREGENDAYEIRGEMIHQREALYLKIIGGRTRPPHDPTLRKANCAVTNGVCHTFSLYHIVGIESIQELLQSVHIASH